MLTRIYGAEDWDAAAEPRTVPKAAVHLDPDRVAGQR